MPKTMSPEQAQTLYNKLLLKTYKESRELSGGDLLHHELQQAALAGVIEEVERRLGVGASTAIDGPSVTVTAPLAIFMKLGVMSTLRELGFIVDIKEGK